MPVQYQVIKKGKPGDPAAPAKYYAKVILSGKSDIETVTERVEKMSTMSGADIRGVVYSLVEVITTLLSEGESVQIEGLGTFRVSVSSDGSEHKEEVTASNIRKSRIIFTPGKKFKRMLRTLEFEKAS